VADLKSCGLTDAQINALPLAPADALPFDEPSAALGILYVIEGSTLGGQVIAKRIREKLNLTPDLGGHYFSSYGANVMPTWRETKAVLDAPPIAVDADRVIHGAELTFEFLSTWLA